MLQLLSKRQKTPEEFWAKQFQKIVNLEAPRALKISRYSGSKVDKPTETETAMGKKEIMKAIKTILIVLTNEHQSNNWHHSRFRDRVRSDK